MKHRIACLFLCLLLIMAAVPAFAEGETEELPARPVITNSSMALLYEESTDTYLYAKKPDYTNPPASMTKVMTAVLVLEHDPELKGSTTVSSDAVSLQYCYWMTDNHLMAGEELSVWDLMNYLLIPSGNEAGTVLAEYVAGSIPDFITMMNDKAKELGMTHTHYADPHGLSELNRITCEDMLILCRYAMQFENFRKIVSSKQGYLPANSIRPYAIRYSTTNRVMSPKGVSRYDTGFSEDIIGIKTGYISLAGNNLACCMVHDDLTFYSVVMHAHDEQQPDGSWLEGHYMDTHDLMVWARSFRKEGFAAGEQVAVTSTALSPVKNLPLVAASDVYILTREGTMPRITLKDTGFAVKAGDRVGSLSLRDCFGNDRRTDLLAAADAAVTPLSWSRSLYAKGDSLNGGLLSAAMPTIPSFTKPPFTVEEGEPSARVVLDKKPFSVKAGDRVGTLVLEDAFGNVRETALLAGADAATSPLLLLIPAAILLAVAVLLLAKRKKKQ